jgi:hypothetical protein
VLVCRLEVWRSAAFSCRKVVSWFLGPLGTPVATWSRPIWVVSRRRVLEAVFILLEFPSPSRRIFIGSHSFPPLWFAVSVLHPGRPAQPSPGPISPSFDLAAIRAIYSPGVERHTWMNSSSAAEEQRREGHHPGEERVELVD